MATIQEKFAKLAEDKQDLIDNLEAKGITGLTGDETFTELVPEVLNIPSGSDISEYFTTLSAGSYNNPGISLSIKKIPLLSVNGTSLSKAFSGCTNLTTIPLIDTSHVTNMGGMFASCTSLTAIPLIDTSHVNSMNSMFYNCSSLTTIPLIDTRNVNSMNSMFSGCTNLTGDSLNNILKMCANATSYSYTKTLFEIFGNTDMSSSYPASTIQSLSNYQDFINAGWTIGWS